MRHPMRRSERQTSREQALSILKRADYAVLSLIDSGGEPYGVPLSFVFDEAEQTLLFHAARGVGRKLDCIAVHQKTNLPAHCTVVTDVRTIPEKFSTEYSSVMISGPVDLLEDTEAKMRALLMLGARYSPEYAESALSYAQGHVDRVDIIRLKITELTGKSRIRKRQT